jgi:hypothetical protein
MRIFKKIIFLGFFISQCSSTTQKFERLAENEKYPNRSLVYLVRDFNPTLSIWKYKINIRKIKTANAKEITDSWKTIELKSGEYCLLDVDSGLYSFQIEEEIHRKIMFLKPSTTYFLHFEIVSKGIISFPEFFLKEYPKEKAIEILLEEGHLIKSEVSADCNP